MPPTAGLLLDALDLAVGPDPATGLPTPEPSIGTPAPKTVEFPAVGIAPDTDGVVGMFIVLIVPFCSDMRWANVALDNWYGYRKVTPCATNSSASSAAPNE
ncbi:Uncharacterised protein [Mycobacteroides abscessus subsp. abscessus]|nr:Uncharacterised protein [Mycobacteroides abscessus subsp. abscessus]